MGIFRNIRLWGARRRYNPDRETLAYPKLLGIFGRGGNVAPGKPSPANLRYFSRTPYARKAINTIKNPVVSLPWEFVPRPEYAKSQEAISDAETITRCFKRPNATDSSRSLIEQFVEDALVFGSGVIEQAVSGDPVRPLWLWPVDAQTIKPVAKWDGDPKSVRFYQSSGYTSDSISADINAKPLTAESIVYMRLNPATDTPYGFGPLEIAYMSIARQLGVSTYAANLASNAQPENMIYVGEATSEEVAAFRTYWRNEIEGQGQTPIIGNGIKADVLKLHNGTDDALYLKWQEFLIRELATAFGLSPQNLGLESDVNRSTAEVAEDRDWDGAIKPMASAIASHVNREILGGMLGMPHIEFRFVGLDREDEKATAGIFDTYYKSNVLTPNEQRERLGLQPSSSRWADMTWADVQIAIAAARGAKQIDDPELTSEEPKNGA